YSQFLPAGDYKALIWDCAGWWPGIASEWYPDRPDEATAEVLTVVPGGELAGIDAVLEQGGGRIVGTVREPGGGGLDRICVGAIEASTGLFGSGGIRTEASGAFLIDGLLPGSYRVRFQDCARHGTRYLGEWYDDSEDEATSTSVEVFDGE